MDFDGKIEELVDYANGIRDEKVLYWERATRAGKSMIKLYHKTDGVKKVEGWVDSNSGEFYLGGGKISTGNVRDYKDLIDEDTGLFDENLKAVRKSQTARKKVGKAPRISHASKISKTKKSKSSSSSQSDTESSESEKSNDTLETEYFISYFKHLHDVYHQVSKQYRPLKQVKKDSSILLYHRKILGGKREIVVVIFNDAVFLDGVKIGRTEEKEKVAMKLME